MVCFGIAVGMMVDTGHRFPVSWHMGAASEIGAVESIRGDKATFCASRPLTRRHRSPRHAPPLTRSARAFVARHDVAKVRKRPSSCVSRGSDGDLPSDPYGCNHASTWGCGTMIGDGVHFLPLGVTGWTFYEQVKLRVRARIRPNKRIETKLAQTRTEQSVRHTGCCAFSGRFRLIR